MRAGFCKVPITIFSGGIKPLDLVVYVFYRSHFGGFKPSLKYTRRCLGMHLHTLKGSQQRLREALPKLKAQKDIGFFFVPNFMFELPLSRCAMAILIYSLSLKKGQKPTVIELRQVFGMSYATIQKGLKTLEENDYLGHQSLFLTAKNTLLQVHTGAKKSQKAVLVEVPKEDHQGVVQEVRSLTNQAISSAYTPSMGQKVHTEVHTEAPLGVSNGVKKESKGRHLSPNNYSDDKQHTKPLQKPLKTRADQNKAPSSIYNSQQATKTQEPLDLHDLDALVRYYERLRYEIGRVYNQGWNLRPSTEWKIKQMQDTLERSAQSHQKWYSRKQLQKVLSLKALVLMQDEATALKMFSAFEVPILLGSKHLAKNLALVERYQETKDFKQDDWYINTHLPKNGVRGAYAGS